MMGVQPARVGQHPNQGFMQAFGLLAERGLGLLESMPIRADAEHRYGARCVTLHSREKSASARDELFRRQFVSRCCRTSDQIRYTTTRPQQLAFFPRREQSVSEAGT